MIHGPSENVEFNDQIDREYDAWLKVMDQLRYFGVGSVNEGQLHQPIWRAIVKWGEELAELRRLDPNPENSQKQLTEKREL